MDLEKRQKSAVEPFAYQITIEGIVKNDWSDWFSGMGIFYHRDAGGLVITILSGVIADQAELRGLLTKLWDLNVNIISVIRIDHRLEFQQHHQEY